MRTRNRNAVFVAARGVVVGTALIGMVNAARGQTSTWIGAGTDPISSNPDSSWLNTGNWSPLPPGPTDTALFNQAPTNGLTTISLGAMTQNIGNLTFDTANVPSYTIGADPADVLGFLATGKIISTSTVTNSQTIAAGVNIASGTLTIANSATSTTLTMGGPITGAGSVTIAGAATANQVFTLNLVGNNTYSGGTNLTSNSATAIVLNSNTAFGASTGLLTMNNTSGLNIQPAGDRQISNPVLLASGYTVSANATTPGNLTFTGAISASGTGRTMTINDYGKAVYFGLPGANASTITLSTGSAQTMVIIAGNNSGTAASIVINDVIQDPAAIPATPTALSIGGGLPDFEGVVLINGANTYSGKTTITPSATGSPAAPNPVALTVGVGSSSVVDGSGNIISGPFGKGVIQLANGNGNAPSIFEPIGGDRVIANAFIWGSSTGGGFFVNNPSNTGVLTDTSPHNLIFSGPMTATARTVTNNLAAGVGLYFGSGAATSIMTDTGTPTLQSNSGHAVNYIIGDQVVSTTATAGFTIKELAVVSLLNNNNSYSGTTTVQNASGAGSLIIGAPHALGNGANLVLNGGNATATAGLIAPVNLNGLTISTATTAGFLDLQNNAMVLNYTANDPVSTVRGYLTTGFNQGAWNGGGINSSTAASDASMLHGLGYNDLTSGSTFDGVTLASNAVAVRYTYYGDTNLDGTVDTTDFSAFIDGVANGGNSWATGDFTYDGKADLGNDFNLFLASYLTLHPGGLGDLAPIVEASSLSDGQKASLLAAIPEPTSLGLLAAGAMGLMARRRRRDA